MSESDEDDSQKTEDPTPKKLSEAKEKGNVSSSKEVNNFVVLAAATLVIAIMSGYVASSVKDTLVFFIESPHTVSVDMNGVGQVMAIAIIEIGKILLLPLCFLMVMGVVSSVSQTGFIFSGEQMTPNIDKISPLKGFKRLFGARGFVELAKGAAKLVVIGSIAFYVIKQVIANSESYVGYGIVPMLEMVRKNILIFMTYVLFIFFFVAILDYMYQKFEWMKKLRMSKQEIKDEYRQTEGDPKIKAKLKQMRIQKARQRMMQNVPKADVVITNPTHYAVALEYKMEEMDAPVCLAKGHDALALRIRELAEENKIPIVEEPPLARALYATVELEEQIPEEHFQAVAKVISYVMSLKR